MNKSSCKGPLFFVGLLVLAASCNQHDGSKSQERESPQKTETPAVITTETPPGKTQTSPKIADVAQKTEAEITKEFERLVGFTTSKHLKNKDETSEYELFGKKYYSRDIRAYSEVSYDVEKTNSLVSPYTASLSYRLDVVSCCSRSTKQEASQAPPNHDEHMRVCAHYAYQKGRWEYKSIEGMSLNKEEQESRVTESDDRPDFVRKQDNELKALDAANLKEREASELKVQKALSYDPFWFYFPRTEDGKEKSDITPFDK